MNILDSHGSQIINSMGSIKRTLLLASGAPAPSEDKALAAWLQ